MILIDEPEANTTLVGIVASQVRAWLQHRRGKAVPVLVVPDENELVSAQVYEVELETVAARTGPRRAQQYDTDIMTPQKRLLYIIGPRVITPTLWMMRMGRPRHSGACRTVQRDPLGSPRTKRRSVQVAIASRARDHGLDLDDALIKRISAFASDPSELAGAFRRAAMTETFRFWRARAVR